MAIALTLLLSGCGDDDASLSRDEQKAARALAVEFQGQDPTDFARDTGICLGKHLVNDLGTRKLIDGGLLKEDLTVATTRKAVTDRSVAEGYADAIVACQDVRGQVESRRDRYPKATDADIDTYVDCVEAIDDTVLHRAIVAAALKKPDPSGAAYTKQSKACAQKLGPPKAE